MWAVLGTKADRQGGRDMEAGVEMTKLDMKAGRYRSIIFI